MPGRLGILWACGHICCLFAQAFQLNFMPAVAGVNAMRFDLELADGEQAWGTEHHGVYVNIGAGCTALVLTHPFLHGDEG